MTVDERVARDNRLERGASPRISEGLQKRFPEVAWQNQSLTM